MIKQCFLIDKISSELTLKLSTKDVVACADDVNKVITSKLILKIFNIFFKKLNPFLFKFKKNGYLRIWLITLLFVIQVTICFFKVI